MKKLNAKMIAICGILTAMTIVLAEFLGINLPMIQISFNFIPIVFAAMYLGPIPACIIAALADFVGALLFQGSVNPFITIIAAIMGLGYGVFLYSGSPVNKALTASFCKLFKSSKHPERIAVVIVGAIAVLFDIIVVTFILTPITLHIYYNLSYAAMYPTRILKALIMLPLETVVISLMDSQLIPRLRKTSLLRGV
ncbi:MAG: folate family ECF transporter S component [Clostridiales bacterium]|nr:folate family ECF transporter S component [Clostridiales bacterium]